MDPGPTDPTVDGDRLGPTDRNVDRDLVGPHPIAPKANRSQTDYRLCRES